MFCSNCGQKNEFNAKFCPNCGNNLSVYQSVQQSVQQPVQQPMQQTMQHPVQQPMMNSSLTTSKSKNKIIFVILGVIFGIILFTVCLSLFFNKIPISHKNTVSNYNRTIMIYMIGSDLESESGMATLDIEEIEKSGINLSDTNIVVYAGGTKKWNNGFQNNSIYELKENGFELVKKEFSASMGVDRTLTNFLNYVKNNYKSNLYGLILWDHGSGPVIGYGIDEVYEDNLFMYEIESAIENSKFSNEKFEFVGFDACLMASAEIASVLSKYTNYMVASQDLEPGHGWDYSFLSNVNKDINTESLGKLIIDYTDNYYKEIALDLDDSTEIYTTLSLLDLTKMKGLETNLNNLFKDVDITLSNNGYSKIVSKMTRVTKFGYAGYNQSYDLIDLGGVVDELSLEYKDKAQSLKESIDEVVIYQKSNVNGANGISIYYPYYTKQNLDKFLEVYDTLDFAEDYTKFLKNHSKILTGKSLYNYNFKNKNLLLTNNNETISVDLDDNEVINYNNADYVIFRDMKDGYFMPVYKSSDVTLKNNKLIANFNKKQLSVTDAEGEIGWATMYEYERTNSYVLYNVPAVIIKTKNGYDSESVNIQLKVDSKNPNGVIIGVVPAITVEDSSRMKKDIKLEDWDYIQFFNSEYDFYDENGNYTDEWKSSGTVYLMEVSLEKGYQIKFTELENEYNYYCMFQVHDTQGNIHYTDLIKIN